MLPRWAVVFCLLVAADAVAAVLRTIAAQSANFIAVNIFVSWLGGIVAPPPGASMCVPATWPSAWAHAGDAVQERDTKAPGSIPAGGKQVDEATRMSVLAVRSGSLLPYSWRAIIFGWTRRRAEPGALTR